MRGDVVPVKVSVQALVEAPGARFPLAVDSGPMVRHPVGLYLAALASTSRRQMEYVLERTARLFNPAADLWTFPWWRLEASEVVMLKTYLQERKPKLAPATVNQTLIAVRGVLRKCRSLHLLTSDVLQDVGDVELVKGKRIRRGRALDARELGSLVASCRADGPLGARDGSILALLYGAGLRRAEAAALDLQDFDPEAGTAHVREGKGNKERRAWIAPDWAPLLGEWISARGAEHGPLLYRFSLPHGPKAPPGSRMAGQGIAHALAVRARKAGVAPFRPHDLRRSFITHLLLAGVDVLTVRLLAAHEDVRTTALYDERPEREAQAAVRLIRLTAIPPASAPPPPAPPPA